MLFRVPKPGQVLEFSYDFHDPTKHRFGKVTSVRDTRKEPIAEKTLLQSNVKRSRYLISCAMFDGTYRNFYDKGLTGVRKVGIIRRTLLRLSGVTFGETARNEKPKVGKVG